MTQTEIENILKEYKRNKKEDILHLLPIYQGEILMAYLRPITFDYKISLPGVVTALSTWRRNTPYAWNSIFDVTNERTEMWLEKFVLNNRNRIIFIIQDIENHFIGQIGLAAFNEHEKSAEIDAVVRGEKSKLPGIMSAALKTIIMWGKNLFFLEHIYLDVFDDNIHAIEFYKKNGFIELDRISLSEIKSKTETKWKIDEKINPDLAPRCYIRMKLKA